MAKENQNDTIMVGDFTRGKATHNDLAEKYNPFYVFCWAIVKEQTMSRMSPRGGG